MYTLTKSTGGCMKVLKLSLLCSLIAGLSLAWSGTYDLTLQEGVDGYAGTSDAYGRSQSSSSNYGSSQTLNLLYERCSS